MHLSLLLLSVIGLTTGLPSPSGSSALSILASRGIDPNGPIPSDVVPLPNGGYTFSADSNTAHWVRVHNAGLSKRAISGLSVTLWGGFTCDGNGAFFPNVEYAVSCLGAQEYYATVEFRGGALLGKEQMDFSRLVPGGADRCASYVESFVGGTPAGCY